MAEVTETKHFPVPGELFAEPDKVGPDLTVENHGSIVLLRGLTPAGKAWVEDNIPEEALTFAGAIVVEPRYIDAIVEGAINDGLEVA